MNNAQQRAAPEPVSSEPVSSEPASSKPTFLFDGDCAFCSSCARWIERHLPRQPRVLAWQLTELEPLGVTAAEAAEAVQWVGAQRGSGADAVGRLLAYQGGLWAVAGRLLLLPGVGQLARPATAQSPPS